MISFSFTPLGFYYYLSGNNTVVHLSFYRWNAAKRTVIRDTIFEARGRENSYIYVRVTA
jgi:hypothetical protein